MLKFLRTSIGCVLRTVVGLAMVAVALSFSLIVAAAVLLRLAWLRGRPGRAQPARAWRAGAASGEVIDVEVREVRNARGRQRAQPHVPASGGPRVA